MKDEGTRVNEFCNELQFWLLTHPEFSRLVTAEERTQEQARW